MLCLQIINYDETFTTLIFFTSCLYSFDIPNADLKSYFIKKLYIIKLHFMLYILYYVLKVKVIQSCPALCDPKDYTFHGILQARILEWVAFPSPGDLPNPGIKPRSPSLQADSLPAEPQGKSKTF